jgi:ribosomal protein L21E
MGPHLNKQASTVACACHPSYAGVTGRIEVQDGPVQNVQYYLKNKLKQKRVRHVLECLLNKCKAPSSNLSTTRKEKHK